jgi:hypothetical protein
MISVSNMTSQSFSVEDIRRLRIELDRQREGMTPEEISRSIEEGAEVGRRILADIRRKKAEAAATAQ